MNGYCTHTNPPLACLRWDDWIPNAMNMDQNAFQLYDAKQEPPSWINEITALMSRRKYRKTLVGHFQIKNKVDRLDFFKA